MKKLLSMCMLAALSCGVGNAQSMRQVELKSDNNLNYFYYGYNTENKVDSIYQEITGEGYSSYRLFTYDENGNNVMQQRYQMSKDMDTYLYTDYVNYTYDEKNRIISRKNYNLDMWGGTNNYVLGGVYVYEYDADNKLTKRNLYWDEELTRLYESIVYEYDADGRLFSDTRSTEQFGMWVEDFKEVFEYNNDGKISKITFYSLDYGTGNLMENNYRTYTYDDNGNLIEKSDFLMDNAVNEKHEYTHNSSIESANTIFPINIDDDKTLYSLSENVIAEDKIYMRDVKTGELVYIDTEMWVYEENNNTGIETVNINNSLSLMSMNADMVELGNVANGENVRIYNTAGNMVNNASYNNGVNISNLPSGIYMVVTKDSCIKIRK